MNGLGVSASFTSFGFVPGYSDHRLSTGKVTGTQKTPFFAVSDSSYNVTLAYEKSKFSARLSYEWRAGSFLHHYEAALFANPIGVYDKPERSMDVQFSYRLTKNLVLTLDATNLTNEIYQSYYGNKPGNSTTNNFGNSLYSRTIALECAVFLLVYSSRVSSFFRKFCNIVVAVRLNRHQLPGASRFILTFKSRRLCKAAPRVSC